MRFSQRSVQIATLSLRRPSDCAYQLKGQSFAVGSALWTGGRG